MKGFCDIYESNKLERSAVEKKTWSHHRHLHPREARPGLQCKDMAKVMLMKLSFDR